MKLVFLLALCVSASLCMEYDELDARVRDAVESRDLEAAHRAIEEYTQAFQEAHGFQRMESDSAERHEELRARWMQERSPSAEDFEDGPSEVRDRVSRSIAEARARMEESFSNLRGDPFDGFDVNTLRQRGGSDYDEIMRQFENFGVDWDEGELPMKRMHDLMKERLDMLDHMGDMEDLDEYVAKLRDAYEDVDPVVHF